MEKNKNIFDDYTVDAIPKGKEKEYFSEEQSAEIIRRLKEVTKFSIILSIFLIIYLVISTLKEFIEFPLWLNILITSILIVGFIICIIIGVIKYIFLTKYVKSISIKYQ